MLLKDLGAKVGLSNSTLSDFEHDKPKGGIAPQTLIRIAAALDAPSLLIHFCGSCPVRQEILSRRFPELNSRKQRGPSFIASLLRQEMEEGLEAVERLKEVCADTGLRNSPDREELFRTEMGRILEVKNCIDTLEWELLFSGFCTFGPPDRNAEENPGGSRE